MPDLTLTPGLRTAVRRVGLCFAIAAGLFVAAVIGTARSGDRSLWPSAAGAPATEVFVVSHGYHAGIVVPRRALAEQSGRRGLRQEPAVLQGHAHAPRECCRDETSAPAKVATAEPGDRGELPLLEDGPPEERERPGLGVSHVARREG